MLVAMCGFLLSPLAAVDANAADRSSDTPDKIIVKKDKNGNIKEIIVIKKRVSKEESATSVHHNPVRS